MMLLPVLLSVYCLSTEDWKVEQPILAFTDVVDLKYNNPALATNDQIKIIDLINALNVKATEASYKKWTNLTLKDAVGNTLVKYDVTKIAAEETIAETLYRKNAAGNAVAEATGLEISLDENGYLFATWPANTDKPVPTIGFIAHMDTSPDMTGAGVTPRIVYGYDGTDIVLCEEDNIILSPKQFPELLDHKGGSYVTTQTLWS